MVSKNIDLGNGLKFESITSGKEHFDKILKVTPLETRVAAQEFDEINALYEAYCRKTNYPIGSPPVAFFPTNEIGKGYTTRCFGVKFEMGLPTEFRSTERQAGLA
jgi:hypothetical protein